MSLSVNRQVCEAHLARQPLTTTPVNLVTAQSLEADTRYLAQADTEKSGDTQVHITESENAPTDLNGGHKLGHLKSLVLEPDGTNGIWAWVPTGLKRGELRIERAI